MTLPTGASSFAAVDADNGDEPALTLEDRDYATECLPLNTVTSLAAGLECIALIFTAGHHLTRMSRSEHVVDFWHPTGPPW